MDEFCAILARGMRLAFLLTIPSAIGLAMLASPIISVIYEHGRFTAAMTRQTAGALRFYAIGLVAYSALKVLTPAFLCDRQTQDANEREFPAIGLNLFLNWFFTFRLLGTSRLAFFDKPRRNRQFLLLYGLMRRHARNWKRPDARSLWKICVAGVLLALVWLGGQHWWLDAWERLRFLEKLCASLSHCSWRDCFSLAPLLAPVMNAGRCRSSPATLAQLKFKRSSATGDGRSLALKRLIEIFDQVVCVLETDR